MFDRFREPLLRRVVSQIAKGRSGQEWKPLGPQRSDDIVRGGAYATARGIDICEGVREPVEARRRQRRRPETDVVSDRASGAGPSTPSDDEEIGLGRECAGSRGSVSRGGVELPLPQIRGTNARPHDHRPAEHEANRGASFSRLRTEGLVSLRAFIPRADEHKVRATQLVLSPDGSSGRTTRTMPNDDHDRSLANRVPFGNPG